MAMPLPSASLPVYGTPARSSSAWSSPPSPCRPCSTRKTMSASLISGISVSRGPNSFSRRASKSSGVGGSRSTTPVNRSASPEAERGPETVSTMETVCPSSRRAATTCALPARATSRSGVDPPVKTVTRWVTAGTRRGTRGPPTARLLAPKRGGPPFAVDRTRICR